MPRPIMLSIAGDSGSGKTTITRGVVRVLGDDRVTHFCADDYHRYDRSQRAEHGITPLNPECNYLDVLTCDIRHLRHNQAILKPVYRHADGTFGPPVYMSPARFVIAEGLLINHTAELRDMFDIRVYLNPPEEVRRRWKVSRDCSRRGYSTDQVLMELDRRERDSEAYIRPQRHYADIVVSFTPGQSQDPAQLDAHLFLRDSLPHPDLTGVVGDGTDADDITLTEQRGEQELRIPGTISAGRAVQLEEAIWGRMQFASHLRTQRLGEFTIGSDLHRSEALGLTQLLLLYHLVTARAVIALGGQSARSATQPGADGPVPDTVRAASAGHK
jgi:phosphoribulokinase